MTTDLIRNGSVVKVKGINAIKEQILQIAMDYPSIPDPLQLDTIEIDFYYKGLYNTLKQSTGNNGK